MSFQGSLVSPIGCALARLHGCNLTGERSRLQVHLIDRHAPYYCPVVCPTPRIDFPSTETEVASRSLLHSLSRSALLNTAHMPPKNTFGPDSGRNRKRRESPLSPNLGGKRAQVAAACQNCRAKKTKVGRHLQECFCGGCGWFSHRVITVRCTLSLHSLRESPPHLSI